MISNVNFTQFKIQTNPTLTYKRLISYELVLSSFTLSFRINILKTINAYTRL